MTHPGRPLNIKCPPIGLAADSNVDAIWRTALVPNESKSAPPRTASKARPHQGTNARCTTHQCQCCARNPDGHEQERARDVWSAGGGDGPQEGQTCPCRAVTGCLESTACRAKKSIFHLDVHRFKEGWLKGEREEGGGRRGSSGEAGRLRTDWACWLMSGHALPRLCSRGYVARTRTGWPPVMAVMASSATSYPPSRTPDEMRQWQLDGRGREGPPR